MPNKYDGPNGILVFESEYSKKKSRIFGGRTEDPFEELLLKDTCIRVPLTCLLVSYLWSNHTNLLKTHQINKLKNNRFNSMLSKDKGAVSQS